MLVHGILNPQILSLLAHVRHTNALVISDRGFPFWPYIETIDISLIDDIPTVLNVFNAIKDNFEISEIYMAAEFQNANTTKTYKEFSEAAGIIPLNFEPHVDFKKRVPNAIGLIRTGDTIQYANMILISGPIEAGSKP
jgi:D-ribose pyranase